MSFTLHGLAVSGGIAIGQAHLISHATLEVSHLVISSRLVDKEVDAGEGVLVMTDIFGATPGNLALKLLDPGHVEGVAGASLPMLLRALTYRGHGMETMLEKALSGGRDGVIKLPAG